MKKHTITRWFDDTTNQYVVSFGDYRELHLKLEIAKEVLQEIKFAALQGDETSSELTCYNLAGDCLFNLESAGE